jgi:hypothetical protein
MIDTSARRAGPLSVASGVLITKLKGDLNRYDGCVALSSVRPDKASMDGEVASIELALSEEHEIEIYFPAPQGEIDDLFIALAKDVLENLSDMDNAVQRSCADDCARTGHHSRDYESYLA